MMESLGSICGSVRGVFPRFVLLAVFIPGLVAACRHKDSDGVRMTSHIPAVTFGASRDVMPPVGVISDFSSGLGKRFYVGHWEPISSTYQSMGELDIEASGKFRWLKCSTTYVQAENSNASTVLLLLDPVGKCRLNNSLGEFIRFVRIDRGRSRCETKVVVYVGARDVELGHVLAEGDYARIRCDDDGMRKLGVLR